MAKLKDRMETIRLVGQVGYHVATERFRRSPRTELSDIPPSPDHLTREWLTMALCQRVPGAEVVSFQLGPRNDGTSARRTLRVEYNLVGRQAGLPVDLFTKSAPSFLNRMVGAGARLAQIEANFYQLVRPQLSIETPEIFCSAFDPSSHRLMLITDDISVTRGAVFGSALDRELTLAQAEGMVATLASLHAKYWNQPLGDLFGDWLRGTEPYFEMLDRALNAPARIASGFERARSVIPHAVQARREEVYPALVASQRKRAGQPTTFLHGDVHPGNWYLTRDGNLGVYDWQMSVIGTPARDLAYALTTHLSVDQRRDWERALIQHYRQQLAIQGVVSSPSDTELFDEYRRQVVYGMFAWLATIGRSPLQPQYQPDDVSLTNLRRITQACADLNTLDAFR